MDKAGVLASSDRLQRKLRGQLGELGGKQASSSMPNLGIDHTAGRCRHTHHAKGKKGTRMAKAARRKWRLRTATSSSRL